MTIKIRRNADGQQNLNDLRKALAARSDRRVHRFGGNWIISVLGRECWYEKTCRYNWGERQTIQSALGMDVESASEAKHYAAR